MASRAIDGVQASAAASATAALVEAIGYDAVLAEQQHLIYAQRRPAAAGENLADRVRHMIDKTVRAEVAAAARERPGIEQILRKLRELYPVSVTAEGLAAQRGCPAAKLPPQFIADQAAADAQRAYDSREAELGAPVLRDVERRVILAVTDRAWREHLQAMEDLLTGIGIAPAAAVHRCRSTGAKPRCCSPPCVR